MIQVQRTARTRCRGRDTTPDLKELQVKDRVSQVKEFERHTEAQRWLELYSMKAGRSRNGRKGELKNRK